MNEVTRTFVHLFNDQQDFYECHEIFELAWKAADESTADAVFYKALVQVATAQFKLKKGILSGVRKLFQFAAPELAKLPAVVQGIDIARLRYDFAQQFSLLPQVTDIPENSYTAYGLTLLHLYTVEQ